VIFYLAAARQAGAMAYYLQHSGKALAKRIYVVPYEQMFASRSPCSKPAL
jgi:hypothetical protein